MMDVDLRPSEIVTQLRKPGKAFVMVQLSADDEYFVQANKQNLIELFKELSDMVLYPVLFKNGHIYLGK
jgi:hypothetical protein